MLASVLEQYRYETEILLLVYISHWKVGASYSNVSIAAIEFPISPFLGQFLYGRSVTRNRAFSVSSPNRTYYTVEKELYFFPTERFDRHIQSKKIVDGCSSRIPQSKKFKNPTRLMLPHQNTHANIPIPGTTVSYNNADASLAAITAADSRRKSAQHSTAQHSTAQHSTAQHSTAQHSTAQHSTAQHSTVAQS